MIALISITPEEMAAFASLFGTAVAALIFLWRVFKACGVFLKSNEDFKKNLETIKAEVTPNGGASLKDIVNGLKVTCESIEECQKVADQRSKAALHYHMDALFEIDETGSMTWCNERFRELTAGIGDIHDGKDWISIVHDDDRADFISELRSCLKMCRKIDIDTRCAQGAGVRFVGFPYRVSTTTHKGFLINCFFHNLNQKES
jgi:PAS domain-containing protein